MKKVVLIIIILIVSVGCSGSDDGNTKSNNIMGSWSSNCSNSQDVSFPNLMGFFTLYGVMELEIDETNITATMHTYMDDACTIEGDLVEIFHGSYEIKEKIKLTNNDIVNRVDITGSLVPVLISLELNMYYLLKDDELYFSDQTADTPSINYDYYYFKK